MQELVFFYSEGHEAHDWAGQAECAARLESVRRALDGAGLWDRYPHLQTVDLPAAVLHAVHDPKYLEELVDMHAHGEWVDHETYACAGTYQVAIDAAGGSTAVARAVWRQEARRGFALVRPPGHHAYRERGMGFCVLNNAALAAEYLRQEEGAQRVAIIDIDVHHGNGTQDIFYQRNDVLYVSMHQFPHYPNSGRPDQIGDGDGVGVTLNVPIPLHTGDRGYAENMQQLVLPMLDRFKPEILLVSAGFDGHWTDPLARQLLTADGYAGLVKSLVDWSDQNCMGRIALILEGGYDLEALGHCALAATQALLGQAWQDPLGASPYPESVEWQDMLIRLKRVWKI